MREQIWHDLNHRQRINSDTITDRVIMSVDLALWDLAGRALNQPVYKLLGGYRDKVPAYASTMCGDDLEGGLATPKDYARFAEWCMKRGYPAFKLHTWQPPLRGCPQCQARPRSLRCRARSRWPRRTPHARPLSLLRPRSLARPGKRT